MYSNQKLIDSKNMLKRLYFKNYYIPAREYSLNTIAIFVILLPYGNNVQAFIFINNGEIFDKKTKININTKNYDLNH